MSRWMWVLHRLMRQLWLRATLIGGLGVLAAILAAVVERFIPWELPDFASSDAVDSILGIIASSMLAVTTFSLSVMTSAYGSATTNASPRATKLMMEDRVTQNVLSTFVGSFLFGIVGIVVLKTGAYGDRGRAVLFIVTIAVIALIVVSLLRWIDYLTRFGRVGETTDRVENATRAALQARLDAPTLGGQPLTGGEDEVPGTASPVLAATVGYIQHVDIPALAQCGERFGVDLYVAALPGTFVYRDTPLARRGLPETGDLDSEAAEALHGAVRGAFTIGDERSFDQDPRFGLAVMSEIALRAMSPAVNDPGTAIDVIGRTTRLLDIWARGIADRSADAPEISFPRIHVPPLKAADLFEDAFMLMARDGAALIEVQLRLQKALAALARAGDEPFRAAAMRQAELALARAEAAMPLEADRQRLRAAIPDKLGAG